MDDIRVLTFIWSHDDIEHLWLDGISTNMLIHCFTFKGCGLCQISSVQNGTENTVRGHPFLFYTNTMFRRLNYLKQTSQQLLQSLTTFSIGYVLKWNIYSLLNFFFSFKCKLLNIEGYQTVVSVTRVQALSTQILISA